VRNSLWFIVLFLVPLASVSIAREQASQAPAPPAAGAPPSAQPQQPTPQQPPPQATYAGPVIVLDPAHGGTDPGARSQNGPVEKDVVLQFARAARLELVRQGYRVVLTRDDDSNPSYDDRAAIANSYHDALFVSLHVSSTGTVGTVRAYFYQFWNPFSPQSKPPASDADQTSVTSPAPPPAPSVSPSSLVPWNEAQRPYADSSHRLGDQLQMQLAQQFPGSPAASKGSAIRGLRSVSAPAVAIEVSSVAATNAGSLSAMAAPLAASIAKGVQAFRPANSAGAK
jgi:N-acetylmuramoyl-L-alanine amidase